MFLAMTLSQLRKKCRLSQARLAQLLTEAGFPATQTLVSQWETGAVTLTAERCVQIERVTAGAIRRIDLRPEIFGDLEAANDDAPPPESNGAGGEGC